MESEQMVERINQLARKSRTEGLNEQEKAEQQQLREAYLSSIRTNLQQVLNSVVVEEHDGSRHPLRPKSD